MSGRKYMGFSRRPRNPHFALAVVGTVARLLNALLLRTFSKSAKKKVLVLSDRAADGKSTLVALAIRFGIGSRIEEITRGQLRALKKVPAAAMESVGAALQHHVYDGAAVVAEFRRKAVVLNFEFLHTLDQRLVVNIGVSSLALFRRADQRAIDPYLGGRIALSVGNEIGSRGIVILVPDPATSVTPPDRNVKPKKSRLIEAVPSRTHW